MTRSRILNETLLFSMQYRLSIFFPACFTLQRPLKNTPLENNSQPHRQKRYLRIEVWNARWRRFSVRVDKTDPIKSRTSSNTAIVGSRSHLLASNWWCQSNLTRNHASMNNNWGMPTYDRKCFAGYQHGRSPAQIRGSTRIASAFHKTIRHLYEPWTAA